MKNEKISQAVAWVQGYLAAKIEGFSHAFNIPPELFTEGLADILHTEGPRSSDRVPVLRRAAARSHKGVGKKVEVDERTHRQPSVKKAGQSKIKQYWANMTPEQRSAEMRRRMGKRK